MAEQENVQQVQQIYAAFGRGDVPAFLDALANDVEWVVPGPSNVPFAGTFRGKAGVQKWLGKVMADRQFQVFEPREFIAQGNKVVALIHSEGTIMRTGRYVINDVAHVWTLCDGKVVRSQSYEDTAAVADAYHGW